MVARLRVLVMVLGCILQSACHGAAPSDPCTVLHVHFSPTDTTIVVGEQFRASVELATCGGSGHVTDAFTWRAADSVIASVNPVSGQVFGRSLGETRILATGREFGAVGGLRLVVQSAGP